MSKPILDLVGQKFGRLTVEVFVGRIKNRSVWQCLCDCGSDKRVEGGHLKDGTTTSCGCFHKEQTSKKNTTHGHYKNGIETPTHRSWAGMIQRCKNPKCKEFKYYGGNGRDVCDRWLESFENFLEDMGECPEGMSLERIDNTKGYYKENCKWATRLEQANNKCNSIWLEFGGERKTLPQWARSLGIESYTLRRRIYRDGWSIERALITPVRGR